MDRLKKHNLIEKIKKFKGITIGSSAGAMIHLDKAHIYKDNDYKKFSYVKGLSFIKDLIFLFIIEEKFNKKKQLEKYGKRNLKIYIQYLMTEGYFMIKEKFIYWAQQKKSMIKMG